MFSSMCYNLLQLKISLLGQISRSEPNDPRRVLFEKGTLIPGLEFRKRPGNLGTSGYLC